MGYDPRHPVRPSIFTHRSFGTVASPAECIPQGEGDGATQRDGGNLPDAYRERIETGFILVSHTLMSIVMVMTFVFFPVYMGIRDYSTAFISFFLSLQGLVTFFSFFIWGALSDRLGRRRELIILGGLLAGLTFLPMADASPQMLLVLRGIQVFFLSSSILVLEILTEPTATCKVDDSDEGSTDTEGPGEDRDSNIGRSVSMAYLVTGIGGIIGGFLYSYLGTDGAYDTYDGYAFFLKVCGFTSIFAVLFMIPTAHVSTKPSHRYRLTMGEVFSQLKEPRTRKIYLLTLIQWLGNCMMFTYFLIYVRHVLDAPDEHLGYIQSLNAGLAVVFSILLYRYISRFNPARVILLGVICYMLMAISFATITNPTIVLIIFGIPLFYLIAVPSTVIITQRTKLEERGRGVGLLSSLNKLGEFLGISLGGILLVLLHDNYQHMFFVSLFIMIPSLMLAVKLDREERGVMVEGSGE